MLAIAVETMRKWLVHGVPDLTLLFSRVPRREEIEIFYTKIDPDNHFTERYEKRGNEMYRITQTSRVPVTEEAYKTALYHHTIGHIIKKTHFPFFDNDASFDIEEYAHPKLPHHHFIMTGTFDSPREASGFKFSSALTAKFLSVTDVTTQKKFTSDRIATNGFPV